MALVQSEIPFRVSKSRSCKSAKSIGDTSTKLKLSTPARSSNRQTKTLIRNLDDLLNVSSDEDDNSDQSCEKPTSIKKELLPKKPGRPVRKLFQEDRDGDDQLADEKQRTGAKRTAVTKKCEQTVETKYSDSSPSKDCHQRQNPNQSPYKSPRKLKEQDIIDALNANIPVRKSPRKKSKAKTESSIELIDKTVSSSPSPKQLISPNKMSRTELPGLPTVQSTPNKTPNRTLKRPSPDKTMVESPVKRTRKQLNFDLGPEEKRVDQKNPKKCALTLIKKDVTPYQKAKKALHTSTPSRILCRNNESSRLRFFLTQNLKSKQAASLYVSGAPGTGKTACIMQLLLECKMNNKSFTSIFINCMSVRQSKSVYEQISRDLECKMSSQTQKEYVKAIEKKLSSKGNMVVIILDEMDHLNSKTQEVLYTIFEWPRLPSSRLILIGIANALDLTDRLLPRLHACGSKPELLNFTPYSQHQILEILQERLSNALGTEQSLFQPEALQFCARKIAASTGDVRKALDTCRRALEKAEKTVRTQQVLTLTTNIEGKMSLDKSINTLIGPPQINAVLHDIYNSKVISCDSTGKDFNSSMPIQQKLLLCSLLLISKHAKNKDITFGRLHEVHCRACKKRQIGKIDASEFLSLCDLVESRGFITLKRHRENRLSKVSLKTDQEELEFVMQDKAILADILTDTSILKP